MSRNSQLTRRRYLRNAASALVALGLAPRLLGSAISTPPDDPAAAWTPLGPLARSKDVLFGFALNGPRLAAEPSYGALAARECAIVVSENAMKWETLHPSPGEYNFAPAEDLMRFAKAHEIQVRGHTFCWHRALPQWVTQNTTAANAEAVLRTHIGTVARHFKGRIHSWDVVNEGIQLRDNQPGGWRHSFWYHVLGPSYVDTAFQETRQADPAALTTYNDFGLEYENRSDTPKRVAVLAMLQDMRKRNIPVDALGVQSHLRAGTGEKFGIDLPHFLDEVHALGLRIFLTEMDLDDSHLKLEGEAREAAITDVYKRYLDLVLSTGKVSVAMTWGVWDLPKVPGAEAVIGPNTRGPLLFSADSQPKPSAFAVAECFRQAPFQH